MGAVENPTATVGFLFTGVAKAKHQNTQPPFLGCRRENFGPPYDATEPTTAAATGLVKGFETFRNLLRRHRADHGRRHRDH